MTILQYGKHFIIVQAVTDFEYYSGTTEPRTKVWLGARFVVLDVTPDQFRQDFEAAS